MKYSLFCILPTSTVCWTSGFQTFKRFYPFRLHCYSGGSRQLAIWSFSPRTPTSGWQVFTRNWHGVAPTPKLAQVPTCGRRFWFGKWPKKLSLSKMLARKVGKFFWWKINPLWCGVYSSWALLLGQSATKLALKNDHPSFSRFWPRTHMLLISFEKQLCSMHAFVNIMGSQSQSTTPIFRYKHNETDKVLKIHG